MKSNHKNHGDVTSSWLSSSLHATGKIAAMLMLGATLTLAACGSPTSTSGAGGTSSQGASSDNEDTTVSNQELEGTTAEVQSSTDSPEQFVGQTVVLNGEVEQVFSANAFALRPNGSSIENDAILVLVTGKEPPALTAGEAVQLTGEIQRFTGRELKGKYGSSLNSSLTTQLADEYEGRPFIVTPVVDLLSAETATDQ